VLVVEDEQLIRETVEILISIEGCDVRTAVNGEDALKKVDGWTPDLILLDLTLPGMSGREFIQAYRKTPSPHGPVVLLTGHTLETSAVQAMGAAGILPKPFDVNDLLDVVANFTECIEEA